ncbi:2OG-Fe(II) oxygenase [Phenylobacterium sp.]|uniref:2OG-Fe(II) oxygenase family protein n=1 Tax=Phenylobacterium sp. TaxID=1871053 RepID=UPI00301D7822
MTWRLPPLSVGEFAPPFDGVSRPNPRFHSGALGGRYVLLAFAPDAPARTAAMAAFDAARTQFDGVRLGAVFVGRATSFDQLPPDAPPGLHWLLDPDGAIAARFRPDEGWLLLDPALRVLDRAPLGDPAELFARLPGLPAPGREGGAPAVAPALIVPRVFEPDLCRTLIDVYEAQGGQPSGVMRDIDGRTVGVLDGMKSRRDVMVEDEDLQARIREALSASLIPMIARTYQFQATRLERFLVACYDAGEGGYFRPHRDNLTIATAHRRFAVSINLNAEAFRGGDLRFPEFGARTYRPPTGGAVVFACSLLHEATPVTQGRRYAFLPFLYDEAGQMIRDQAIRDAAVPKPGPLPPAP